MQLFRAETGCAIHWSRERNTETLEQLYQAIEQCTSIPPDSQILMTSLGSIVKRENFKQVIEATGPDEEHVFCYDRDYLTAHQDIIDAFVEREIPRLEPEIPFHCANILKQIQSTFDKNSIEENCNRYIDFFEKLKSYNESTMEVINTHELLAETTIMEQKKQSMALNVALQNLSSHIKSGTDTACIFLSDAKKEIERQTDLLKYFDDNMIILQNMNIHPAILELLDPQSRDKNKLFDFVDTQHIDVVKAETVQLCKDLKQQYSKLKDDIKHLSEFEEEIKQLVEKNSKLFLLDPIGEDIKSIVKSAVICYQSIKTRLKTSSEMLAALKEETLSIAFENLSLKKQHSSVRKRFVALDNFATDQLSDSIYKLQKCDLFIRKKVTTIIGFKEDSVRQFFKNMNIISNLQGYIADLESESAMNKDQLKEFKQKFGKNDLRSISHAVLAYGALLIEIVRRKEYNQILISNSNTIADVLSEYRFKEEKRREHFRRTIKNLLPFELIEFDHTSPQSEITINGTNQQDQIQLDKKDVQEYISILENAYRRQASISLRKQPSFASSSFSKQPSFATALRTVKRVESDEMMLFFDNMSNQLNGLNSEFLKIIELNFFTPHQIEPARMQEVMNQEVEPVSRPPSITHSTTSSTYSVVVDDKKLTTATINENNQLKERLQQTKEQHQKEIETYQLSLKNLEIEKEELESQVQNFDNERQTFEQNRLSFINELKNKDKTADFRIASAEEDFQSKISDLQYALEEEKRMKKNLEIEHASELNTVHTDHASEIEDLKELLRQEKQKTQDAMNEKWEEKRRADEQTELLKSLESSLTTETQKHKDLQKNTVHYKTSIESLQSTNKFLKSHVDQLEHKLHDKDKVVEEIKMLQEHTKNMVARTKEDWIAKDLELKQNKQDQEVIYTSIKELLLRFCPNAKSSDEFILQRDIEVFKEKLEEFSEHNIEMQHNFDTMTEDLAQLSESHKNLTEVQYEWRAIASRMAEKLEEFRKNILYDLVVKLQLPMDESELNILSRNLSPSDDDAAIWNEVLQLSSAIQTQKFVVGILEHVKNLYDNYTLVKNQLRKTKEKYRHLLISNSEKISFRNFKVGDVALFLPTRNSTGKPWAAFNINAPHYFLHSDDTTSSQMQSREWIVARIVSITENTVDETINPYGLALGLKYYDLEVENWRTNRPKSKKRLIEPDSGLASLGSGNATPPKRPSFSSVASSSSNIVHSYVNK